MSQPHDLIRNFVAGLSDGERRAAQNFAFDESKVNRNQQGEFAPTGGDGGESSEEKPAKREAPAGDEKLNKAGYEQREDGMWVREMAPGVKTVYTREQAEMIEDLKAKGHKSFPRSGPKGGRR